MNSVEEAVETTQTHLSEAREMNTQLQQLKGRIQTLQSVLEFLQANHDAEEFDIALNQDDIAAAQTVAEGILAVISQLIEHRRSTRDGTEFEYCLSNGSTDDELTH